MPAFAANILRLVIVGSALWATVGFDASASASEAQVAGFAAPAIARTASTVLLIWDHPDSARGSQPFSYEMLVDGTVIGTTKKLSYTATGLAAGRGYRFSLRVRDASGAVVATNPEIEAATKPSGPILNVHDFDARGDGQHDDTAAFQRAIAACKPGGTVLVSPGNYLVNHLELKGDLTLHLAAGATVRLLGRDVSRPLRGRVEVQGTGGPTETDYGALLVAVHADHLAITGEGIIDGGGPTWWGHLNAYRPRLFQIVASRDVLIQGVTLQDPPQFNTLLSYVDDAVISGVTFLKRTAQPSANGDALDPDSSRHILIVGCYFGNQDDSIAIKAGLARDSATVRPRSCENIIIRDCRFDGTLAPGSHPLGIAVGSGASGGVRHVLVKDCEFVNTASLANLRINRTSRYGLVEDVRFENCTYTNTVFPDEPWNRAPISLDLFYYSRAEDNPDFAQPLTPGTPFFRDIHFHNITIKNPRGRAVYISGLAEKPLQNITFDHVTASALTGFFARNLDGLGLDEVTVRPERGEPFEWGANVSHRH